MERSVRLGKEAHLTKFQMLQYFEQMLYNVVYNAVLTVILALNIPKIGLKRLASSVKGTPDVRVSMQMVQLGMKTTNA